MLKKEASQPRIQISEKKIVRESLMLYRTIGGEMRRSSEKCTGLPGEKCVFQKREAAWVFVMIFTVLIWQCLQNIAGG